MPEKITLKFPYPILAGDAGADRNGETRSISLSIRYQYILLVVIAFTGIAMSFLAFHLVSDWEAERIRVDFQIEAANRIAAINNVITHNLQAVYALGAFYNASQHVDRLEFKEFVKPLLDRSQSIQALEWIPRIPNWARTHYEKEARRDGFLDFQIAELDDQGVITGATQRSEYFPAYYVEPFEGNEEAVGFDLASNATRHKALNLARTTGRIIATSRITLVQEKENQSGFLVFLPIYKKGMPINSQETRYENLEGFILGVFRIGAMLDEALSFSQSQGVNLSIYDEDNSLPPQMRFLASIQPLDMQTSGKIAYQADNIEGLHLDAIIPVADRNWRIISSPTPDFIAARKTWQPWGVPAIVFFFTGSLICYIWFVLDRTERTRSHAVEMEKAKKELEREIAERRKTKLEKEKVESHLQQIQKMEAIGILAGGIAHDFNNILSSVIGYAELARYDTPELSHARSNVDEVLRAGNRAKELVKQLLTFSRKTEIEKKTVFPHQIIKEDLKLLRASIPATIEIQQDIDPDCGAVIADPTQIDQIVLNLCTNASHALEEHGGQIRVELKRLFLAAEETANMGGLSPGPYVLLTVSDTGHGMDRATLERVFDPYFTTKEVGKGSGLGLAVVHGIVKNLDGTIIVDSAPDQGTAFQVFLPRVEAEADQQTGENEALPTGTERILVVDDESTVVEYNKKLLERFGYRVTAMTSSVEALETFQANPAAFDLIITDQTIPLLPGAKFAQKVLKIRPDIPIILCTGYSSAISEDKATAIGIGAFIMKPVSVKELTTTVRKVLDRIH